MWHGMFEFLDCSTTRGTRGPARGMQSSRTRCARVPPGSGSWKRSLGMKKAFRCAWTATTRLVVRRPRIYYSRRVEHLATHFSRRKNGTFSYLYWRKPRLFGSVAPGSEPGACDILTEADCLQTLRWFRCSGRLFSRS